METFIWDHLFSTQPSFKPPSLARSASFALAGALPGTECGQWGKRIVEKQHGIYIYT